MVTIGHKIIELDFYKGFSAEFSTACCVCLGSAFGLPLSTTHCMVGAIFGMLLVEKTQHYKRFYWIRDEGRASSIVKRDSIVLSKILFWWFITIPVALGFTAGLCWIIK